MFESAFKISDVSYILSIDVTGAIEFHVVGGKKFAPHWYFDDEEEMSVDDLNIHKNAMSVFLKVQEIIIGWIASKNPRYFYFQASTKRKSKLYYFLAKKLAKKLGDHYEMFGFGDNIFEFVKLEW